MSTLSEKREQLAKEAAVKKPAPKTAKKTTKAAK